MGTSLSSIHIFGNSAPTDCGFAFRSFSPGWQTCIDDFSEKAPDYPYTAAQCISKHTHAPVLYFGVFDSEMIWFAFFHRGKLVSRFSDDEFVANKNLFGIPSLVGYSCGQKKRLSSILSCSDTDFKIEMLEEYLGVALLYLPDTADEPEKLYRSRGDILYRQYQEAENALTGKSAPIRLNLIAEYPGKLFFDSFDRIHLASIKPHCFLYGYANDDSHDPTPVRFTGRKLEPTDPETFSRNRIIRTHENPYFEIQYGSPCKITFSSDCPPDFRGKTMTLPSGFYPHSFTPSNHLLLAGNRRICVADATFKVIARLPIKGEIADMVDHYILTATGDSFCGYCYQPKAKIYIYELVENSKR